MSRSPFLWMNICSCCEHGPLGLSVGPSRVYDDDFSFRQRAVLSAPATWEADYHFHQPQIPHRVVLRRLAECHVLGRDGPLARLWRRAQRFPHAGLQSVCLTFPQENMVHHRATWGSTRAGQEAEGQRGTCGQESFLWFPWEGTGKAEQRGLGWASRV